MTYPMKQEIIDALAKIDEDSGLDPAEDEYEAAERVLLDLIKTHGFEAPDAYKIVRTIYWRAWNEGWRRGYSAPK